ncbi:MAG: Fic family protein [Bacteroidales bacterium]|nr:Fic family protein [Bacteroidales bacterium]
MKNEHKPYDTTSPFAYYVRESEPVYGQKAQMWQTAIGLQDVDGLKPSEYLIETAKRHIEGDINIEQVQSLIKSYYESKTARIHTTHGNEEADKVSANITKLLNSNALTFNTNGFLSVHRNLFSGVYKFAGQIRDYNISKKEWVLGGDSVNYMYYQDLRLALDYDIEQERNFSYAKLSTDKMIEHIAKFVSGLWQIHPFGEGNTRTTAVFTILYLRSIGFDVNNKLFADHSWYFRNALVRANYKNAQKGIDYNYTFINMFFRNLLLGEKNELKNRNMLINPPDGYITATTPQPTPEVTPQATPQVKPQSTINNTLITSDNITKFIIALSDQKLTTSQIMTIMNLKDRKNFKTTYIDEAIAKKLVKMLYPDRPNHPKQKYYLTVKGLALLNDIKQNLNS